MSERKSRLEARGLVVESERLRAAWMQYEGEVLDSYLTSDVEDPRVNAQSIISRSFLIDSVFRNEFTTLIREELQFGVCLTFILKALKDQHLSRGSLLESLQNGTETCGQVRIPGYLRGAFEITNEHEQGLSDYISQALMDSASDESVWLPESALSIFERIWQRVLNQREASKISVLEPACGSANDYRYLHSFGISRFLEYTGFDICEKNISNARRRFPDVNFETGNILDMPFEDNSFDFLFVHDLFEHLGPEAIDAALAEVCRVTRKQACLSFFNMADIREHVIKPVGLYHWNTLSLGLIEKSLMKKARDVDSVHIDTLLRSNYGCDDYYNKNAYTLVISFCADTE